MKTPEWIKGFPGAITVCDRNGVILTMNDKAIATFADDGGAALIGTNLLDCHPEPSRTKLRELMASQQTNCYTIEKNGVHKLIYQSPWYVEGEYGGLVEISMEIPHPMPHFVRL
ncbi:MAG: diguanylate cyclase [candidate division Zixibacteria bacterium]|jgi:hypothetical protein|nr:diguanylate cyclase [candidate division Zixibacteria bacterium]